VTYQNGLIDRVLAALHECGPMTSAELVVHLGQTKHRIGAAVNRLRQEWPKTPKRIHITQYVYDQEGQRRYPRPVFSLGDFPDAKRPAPDIRANRQRYEKRVKLRGTTNFVFNLAKKLRAANQGVHS
jgi:hypothetical protein